MVDARIHQSEALGAAKESPDHPSKPPDRLGGKTDDESEQRKLAECAAGDGRRHHVRRLERAFSRLPQRNAWICQPFGSGRTTVQQATAIC